MPSKAFLLGVGSTVATAQTFATSAQTAASIAQSTATSAFSKANNALANASGTFAGSLTVTGDFTSSQSFMRNRIINGGFDIAQRGTSFSNQSAYSLDRWFTNRNGGASGVTFYQAYAAFGTKKNWMTIQRTAGNTDTASAVMYQAIEGINSRDLAGQTVTVSFTVGTGSTLSSTTNNVSTNIYYQTTGTDIGPNGSWTTLSTISWSVPSNTGPTRYIAQFSIPATATQLELVIGFQFAGTAGADDRYYITEVQLEAGSIATPFERRSFGQELILCQRYYEKSFDVNVTPAVLNTSSAHLNGRRWATTYGDASGNHYSSTHFRVEKRVSTSTITLYNLASTGAVQVYAGSYTGGASATAVQRGTSGFDSYAFSYSANAASIQYFGWTADAEL